MIEIHNKYIYIGNNDLHFQEGTVQPKLDRLNTECNFEFRGLEALDTPASSMAGTKMRIGLEVRGPDIIGNICVCERDI